MTYQLTFSRRQAQQGYHGFEIEAESDQLLRAIVQARFSRSHLKSVYLLRPLGSGFQVQRIELRRSGSAEITPKGQSLTGTISHTAGVPGPPPSTQTLPAAPPGSATQAVVFPPLPPGDLHSPGPSSRRPGDLSTKGRAMRKRNQRRRRVYQVEAPAPQEPTQRTVLEVGGCTITLVPHRAVVDQLEAVFGIELPEGPAWWEWQVVGSDDQVGINRQGSGRSFRSARAAAMRAAGEVNGTVLGRQLRRRGL